MFNWWVVAMVPFMLRKNQSSLLQCQRNGMGINSLPFRSTLFTLVKFTFKTDQLYRTFSAGLWQPQVCIVWIEKCFPCIFMGKEAITMPLLWLTGRFVVKRFWLMCNAWVFKHLMGQTLICSQCRQKITLETNIKLLKGMLWFKVIELNQK